MTFFSILKVSLCLRPSDVLLVTYNHMDAIRGFACDNPVISNQVENVYKLLYEVTGCLWTFKCFSLEDHRQCHETYSLAV